jgi:glycerol uptake facilitator-like aquaporin
MTKARALIAYLATVVLLLLGAACAWQFYLMMVQPLGPSTLVIAFGLPMPLWGFDLIVATLTAASFAGAIAIAIILRRSTHAASPIEGR